MQNAAGAFANRGAWHETDPHTTPAFAHSPGPRRMAMVEEALRQLGRQGPASVHGLLDYDGAYGSAYEGNWEGRYRISFAPGEGQEPLVCHAKPFINTPSYKLADEVYAHIRAKSPLLAPALVPFADGEHVHKIAGMDVAFTTYIPGRPVDPNRGDMFAAARGVAVLKSALSALPPALIARIAENGAAIAARSDTGAAFMLSPAGEKAMAARFGNASARTLAAVAEAFQEEVSRGVAPCHADLVPGNYYMAEGNNPLLLDFDNIGGSMFPPDIDIGTVLHRIGIEKLRAPQSDALRQVFDDVRAGYNAGDAEGPAMDAVRLARAMVTAVGWKLTGAFGELAQGTDSYRGAEAKVRRFAEKALDVCRIAEILGQKPC